uniref:Putative reverse transcriptase domain-containing protein n=1 Tax=Tanacetum cinerariifolium TaxID=118510 RepID=A0A6L2LHM5_TANCI|nr:putative reverse transcriptase domain-containing protein [Tanacetum cinerariifolium]
MRHRRWIKLFSDYEERFATILENVLAERLRGLDQQMERKEDGSLYFMDRIWVPLAGDVRRKVLGTRLDLSTAYHPQTDGQSERAIQTLKDMLRACVIDFGGRSPVLWEKIGEGSLIGLELVLETTNKVVLIKEKLKVARDCQKNYTKKRRKPLEFEVGNQVLLKVSPWKGVVRFGKKGGLDMSMISLKVFDHLILSAFVSGDEYSICSRLVIMERNDVLHAMLLQ